jgi:arginine N-succinyltransferase
MFMSFIMRPIHTDDLEQLQDLAQQFHLLNLPGNKKVLEEKIEKSMASFSFDLTKEQSEYLFVVEDLEERLIVGSSLIMGKHGTFNTPHSYFKVLKRDHFSQDLGIGFINQVLRFQMDTDGPTEIGGLLVNKLYRRRPEKLGKQISLIRFLYMANHLNRFEERVTCELTPPLTDEGRSEFWEALGRRFTGLPYQEADLLSQTNKEFIESLFPQDDIYLCLLDGKARLVLGRVAESTKPAQHLLESIGFRYLEEVDPFDGGPHYGCKTKDILPVRLSERMKITEFKDSVFKRPVLLCRTQDDFRGAVASADIRGHEIGLPTKVRENLELHPGDEVLVAPFDYKPKLKKEQR